MARRFRGESHHKVDAKGRVSIPASFRRVLEEGDPNWTEGLNPELVIVYGDASRNFLECFTILAIEEVDAQIEALPRGSFERRRLERLVQSNSFPTSVDETGRLVLPAKLRNKIALDKEAYFAGVGDTFQIWNPDTYTAEEEALEREFAEKRPEGEDFMTLLDGAPPPGLVALE